jgi:hypothetical protein
LQPDSLLSIDRNKKKGFYVSGGSYSYYPEHSGRASVQIIDVIGRVLYREDKTFFPRWNTYPLPALPAGLYLLKIDNQTIKFIFTSG